MRSPSAKSTQPGSAPAEEVDIREKIEFLGSPGAYSDRSAEVEVKETHMSWVFLAGDVVYKLKKPVKSKVLDFSTLADREANCRTEVRLNRRLAPDIYEGVVSLRRNAEKRLALDGDGEVVDWLVKMRRVPSDRMLDTMIERGTLDKKDVDRIADVLAGFFRRAEPAEIGADGYVDRFAREQKENRSMLTAKDFDLQCEVIETVLGALDDFIGRETDALRQRVESGNVVEGHGDLKPEHICLLEPPVVIDCLEFNRTLRLVDPLDELALLGVECELQGAAWAGDRIVERCAEILGDTPSGPLAAFYVAFRAVLRARLALGHLVDPEPREPEKWEPLARRYLAIAERECLSFLPPAARR